MLLLGTRAGLGVATILTLALVAAPEVWFAVGLVAGRAVSILGIWGMVVITWLAMRPLQIVGEWAWSAYGRSEALLNDAQDTQLRLNQMLEELSSANARLTRLTAWPMACAPRPRRRGGPKSSSSPTSATNCALR